MRGAPHSRLARLISRIKRRIFTGTFGRPPRERDFQRAAPLEPAVLGTVDLDQLADAVAPVPRLMHAGAALLALAPEPSFDHPDPDRLAAKADAVQLPELLGCQRWTEIGVPLADDGQRLGTNSFRLAAIARPTALLGDQPTNAGGSIGLQQPQNLSASKSQNLRRGARRQSLVIEIAQHIQPRQFLVAHDPDRHPKHLPSCARAVSFQTGRGVTFLDGTSRDISIWARQRAGTSRQSAVPSIGYRRRFLRWRCARHRPHEHAKSRASLSKNGLSPVK
jgi:hypothetical protein